MNLIIGDTTKKMMKLFGISEYPFSTAILKKHYFEYLSKVHPDKNNGDGDIELTRKAIEAYQWLKNLSIECVSPGEPKKKMKSDDMFSLWVKCEQCNGTGGVKIERYFEGCYNCSGRGWRWKLWKKDEHKYNTEDGRKVCCKMCNGKGKIEHNDRESCYKCKGVGEYELDLNNSVIPKGAILSTLV